MVSMLADRDPPQKKGGPAKFLAERSEMVLCPIAGKNIPASQARQSYHYNGGDPNSLGVKVGRESYVTACRNQCGEACTITED